MNAPGKQRSEIEVGTGGAAAARRRRVAGGVCAAERKAPVPCLAYHARRTTARCRLRMHVRAEVG